MARLRRSCRLACKATIAYGLFWSSTVVALRPDLIYGLDSPRGAVVSVPDADTVHPGSHYIAVPRAASIIVFAYDRVWWRGYGHPTHPPDFSFGNPRYLALARQTDGAWTFTRLTLPFWPVPLAAALLWLRYLALLRNVILVLRSHRRFRAKLARHVCPRCGYDIRATPARCPECGLSFPQPLT